MRYEKLIYCPKKVRYPKLNVESTPRNSVIMIDTTLTTADYIHHNPLDFTSTSADPPTSTSVHTAMLLQISIPDAYR